MTEEQIIRLYGERCAEHCDDCCVCEVWAMHDRIETQARENERLRLDVEAQEALQVSTYHAGLRAGWNFGVSDDNAGIQAAIANTDHIKELRRIREARAALGDSHDQ